MAPDHFFEADLTKLGFFINDMGQIRMIAAPEKDYVFHSTSNDRVNETMREAMHECSREETMKRLSVLGINRFYLPAFTTTKPVGPHVPILMPAPEILKNRKRIIVIVNDSTKDLGVLAYRHMHRELGLNGGSVVNFVKEVIKRSVTGDAAAKYKDMAKDGFGLENHHDTPALIVMNTGQLLYSHKYNKAMTMHSWSAMPRKSVAHGMIRIHDEENRVQGHRTPVEHVKSVFESIVCDSARVAPEAEIYVIAIEGGTEYVLDVLGQDFHKYGARIAAMALIHSVVGDTQIKNPDVRAFLRRRAREWRYSDVSTNPKDCIQLPEGFECPQETSSKTRAVDHIAWNEDIPQEAPAALHVSDDWLDGIAAICPTFAGGHNSAGESILTDSAVQGAVLSFFEEVAQGPLNYHNPLFKPYTAAPQPSPSNPFALDPEDPSLATGFSSLPPEMMMEQAELDAANEKLETMRCALESCTRAGPELQLGRERLVSRIANLEAKIEKLQTKALATGGLRAGEAMAQRENWRPQKEGKKVQFAGVEVDSEVLKAAGLMDTAEEAEKTGKTGEE
ncbi:hypothetical protein ACEQ8H_007168 [Pleosporales sp. CAS-2024a]